VLSRRVFGRLHVRVVDEAAAGLPQGAKVVDLGCGPGRLPILLAEQRSDLEVTGIDISPDMVAVAAQRARQAGVGDRVRFEVADVAALPFADGTVDLLVSTMSQHHWEQHDHAVTEIARVLRAGGQGWIYDLRFVPRGPLVSAAGRAGIRVDISRVGPGRLKLRPYVRFTVKA
jgi:ubiquinone/menaquinone biosynthesis C-methylase UbiE